VVVDLLDHRNLLSAQSGRYTCAKRKALQLTGDVRIHKDGTSIVLETLIIDL
jgi:hypothetical protein